MSEHRTGSVNGINTIGGISTVVCANSTEISMFQNPLVKGIPLFNTTTKELKISDGENSLQTLPDHLHPYTHAPLVHSHIYGPNQPWMMANPRLWYIGDVENHPELIVLDGRDATEDQATYLSTVYTGMKLISEPIETFSNLRFVNENLELTASSFTDPYYPHYLFGEQLNIDSVSLQYDQWMTTSTDLTAEAYLHMAFSGGYQYRPMMYVMSPGTGSNDAPFKVRPTPAEWYLEGSNDNSTWTELDHQTAQASDWKCFGYRVYEIDNIHIFSYVRLRITSWNAGAEENMKTGLRRFWLFGRKNGVFSLPKLESPHPDFVWVVPITDLYVGLKHEDVGDIGWTALTPANYPYYRIPCDGSSYQKTNEPLLFAAIGHQYDPRSTISSPTTSSGTIMRMTGGSAAYMLGIWDPGLTDRDTPAYVELSMSTPSMLGGYQFSCPNNDKPKSWVVEGWNGEAWITLQTFTNVPSSAYDENGVGKFYVDSAVTDVDYSKYRFNFIAWNNDNLTPGLGNLEIFTHPDGYFYVPTVTNQDGMPAYIVRENAANDVSTEVIQRLQANMASLAQTTSDLILNDSSEIVQRLQQNMADLAQTQVNLSSRIAALEETSQS